VAMGFKNVDKETFETAVTGPADLAPCLFREFDQLAASLA
jgi:hypothetical protein